MHPSSSRARGRCGWLTKYYLFSTSGTSLTLLQPSNTRHVNRRIPVIHVRCVDVFLCRIRTQRIIDEDTFCPRELRLQLDECYSAMQNILALFGKKEDSLLYAELAKKRPLAAILDENVSAGTESGHMGLFNSWSMERIVRVVSQQNATVVCYTVLQSDLLIWLLQPDKVIHHS